MAFSIGKGLITPYKQLPGDRKGVAVVYWPFHFQRIPLPNEPLS